MAKARKLYDLECKYCGGAFRGSKPRPGLTQSCSNRQCLVTSADEHNSAVAQYRADRAAERAATPRQPRQRTMVMGEWGMAVMLGNGIRKQV